VRRMVWKQPKLGISWNQESILNDWGTRVGLGDTVRVGGHGSANQGRSCHHHSFESHQHDEFMTSPNQAPMHRCMILPHETLLHVHAQHRRQQQLASEAPPPAHNFPPLILVAGSFPRKSGDQRTTQESDPSKASGPARVS
jgi:hypothetical protein